MHHRPAPPRRLLVGLALLVLGGAGLQAPLAVQAAPPATGAVSVPSSAYQTLQRLAPGTSPTSAAQATEPARPVLSRDPSALAATQAHPSQSTEETVLSPPQASMVFGPNANQAQALGVGFQGVTHDLQGVNVYPPSTNVAVSSADVAETVNTSLLIHPRGGGANQTVNLNTLLGIPTASGCGSGSGAGADTLIDPRIYFDGLPGAGRWYISGALVQYNSTNEEISCSQPIIAVADPAGGSCPAAITITPSCWSVYKIPSVAASGAGSFVITDQPKLGYSDDKLVLSWNDCPSGGGACTGEETWVVRKSDILSGTINSDDAVPILGVNGAEEDYTRFSLVPVEELSSNSDEWVVYNNADYVNASQTQLEPTLGTIRIIGTPLGGGVSWQEGNSQGADPQIAPMNVPPLVQQPGTPVELDADDDRLLGATWMNGDLWTTGGDACLGEACGRFIEEGGLSGSSPTPTILQDWDLGAAGMAVFYPAATFDQNGDMIGVANTSTPTSLAAMIAITQAAGSASTVNFTGQFATGNVAYTQPGGCGTGCARWGDYSGAAFDPSDPSGAWVTGEYAIANVLSGSSNDNWATYLQDVDANVGGGYTVDAYGGLHPYGDAPYESVAGAYYPGFNIIRGVVLDTCDPSGHSGWTVDGYGGMHQFGAAPYVSVYGGYYPGWDIIRGAVAYCDQGHAVGYTVDAYGGMHPFSDDPGGVEPPYPQITGYWPGQDLTEGIALIPGTDEGYVVDAYGGLHPFNGAPYYNVSAYYAGFNIIRGVTLLPGGGGGYTVDAYGGLHPFGSAPYEPVSGYYSGWDIMRGVAASSATGGYTVDAYGGLHPYGTAPYLAVTGYFPGQNLIQGVVFTPT
jgi:hypothetical protein